MLKIEPIKTRRIYTAAFDNGPRFGKCAAPVSTQSSFKKLLATGNFNNNPAVNIIKKFKTNPDELQHEFKKVFTSKKDLSCLYLYNLLKAFDRNTAEHSKGVSEIAAGFTSFIGMHGQQVNEMRTAGLLHDIGKLFVPRSILNKAGELTPEEWTLVKKHPKMGKIFLDQLGFSKVNSFFKGVAELVEHHHNYTRSDINTVDSIKQKVEMLRLCDVYGALTENCRPYNKPLSPEKALEKMHEKMTKDSTLWSPELFEKFKAFVNAKFVPEKKQVVA